ncbi:hypothetical protein [Bacillus atrophaeus]|uniref:hypothetical protein n=1 Tax=Bacillus atrophaeus TaxID=1452 RepID=UPI003872F954
MIQTKASRLELLRSAGRRRPSGSRRDQLEVLKTYFNRIRYVHVKDVRKDFFYEVQEKNLDFRQAVRKGVFTMPGDGDLIFLPIVKGLAAKAVQPGWVIVEAEQDPAIYGPYDYDKRAKTYMAGLLVRERNR